MKKTIAYLTLFLVVPCWMACRKAQPAVSEQQLREGFKDPAGTARAKVYWWWLNGFTDRNRIKEELQAIKDAGLGGVDIFEIGFRPDGVVPAGPAFMSDSSLNDIVFAIREATRLGLEVGLNLSSSWNAGGQWVKPEHAAKTLYVSRTQVTGPSAGPVSVPFPEIGKKDPRGRDRLITFRADGRPEFSKEVAVLAIPAGSTPGSLDTSKIHDVSKYFDPETNLLQWDAPAGQWEIHRYVCSNTGENLLLPSPRSHGPILDHFSAEATEAHFTYFIDRLKSQLGDFKGTALKNFYLASFEARTTVWTNTMESEFRQLHGYPLHKFLPALFDKDLFAPEAEAQFREDLNLTISELMIRNHYAKGKEVANRYGLNLISESGGPGPPLHNVPVEAIKALGALDIPRGEFWINHARYDHQPDSIDLLMLVKEIAAASNIYGRRITELEAFTSFQNWQEGPGDMKPVGDRAFCEGMSRPVIHGFTHNPPGMGLPGIVYYAGTHFNDKTTWWPKVKPFNDYLARVSYILQETDFTADVLYYYGDKTPNFVTPKNTRFSAGQGFDYEIINTEILLRDLTSRDGMLELPGGARFRILAADQIAPGNKAVLEKIEKLRGQGAVITDTRYASVTGALSAGNVLPDFDYPDKLSARADYMTDDRPALDFIHHKKGDLDFYFVRNTRNEWISRKCLFRQAGKSPEIWDPVNGETYPVTIFDQQDKQVEVPLTFAPYGSFFVVFSPSGRAAAYRTLAQAGETGPEYTVNGPVLTRAGSVKLNSGGKSAGITFTPSSASLPGPWNITFAKGWGAPENTVFPDLISWTESPAPGIKYFSGSAVYNKTFVNLLKPAAEERVYLDLGKVARVADVWLNGKNLGISWTPPYRYDVTDALKEGENELKIEVINTWSNRIIGDLDSEIKYTSTNVKERGSRELTWRETPLLESGLLGPVMLHTARIIE